METKFNSFGIAVNEASIKNNFLPEGNFQIKHHFQSKIGKANDGDNKYFVEISVEFHNTTENPFPIELIARVSGFFNIEGDNQDEINNFLMTQGFQMVFPHLRALVANMTANAMMPVITLPIMFANQFKEDPVTDM